MAPAVRHPGPGRCARQGDSAFEGGARLRLAGSARPGNCGSNQRFARGAQTELLDNLRRHAAERFRMTANPSLLHAAQLLPAQTAALGHCLLRAPLRRPHRGRCPRSTMHKIRPRSSASLRRWPVPAPPSGLRSGCCRSVEFDADDGVQLDRVRRNPVLAVGKIEKTESSHSHRF